jgi:hypothetical protein
VGGWHARRVSAAPITVHVADDTFVAAAPEVVAAAVHDPARWRRWWPDLEVTSTRDRGVKGHQWLVGGPLQGTAEIWLEPWRDGTVLHLFLRLDFARERGDRHARREHERRVLAWKREARALKDELERGREPGEPAV